MHRRAYALRSGIVLPRECRLGGRWNPFAEHVKVVLTHAEFEDDITIFCCKIVVIHEANNVRHSLIGAAGIEQRMYKLWEEVWQVLLSHFESGSCGDETKAGLQFDRCPCQTLLLGVISQPAADREEDVISTTDSSLYIPAYLPREAREGC